MTPSGAGVEEIAVVGMAGRFPGAPDLDTFWQNLRAGKESIRFFSRRELLEAGVDPLLLDDPRYVRARGTLGDVDRFDAAFFDFTPREAEICDPQQRILLECAWESLETAGYAARSFPGPIGVFVGASHSAYGEAIAPFRKAFGRIQVEIGSDRDHLAPRIAYKLNLRGPALTVQTGCSTSLVAVHLAIQALVGYECDLALAGGVSIGLPEAQGYLYEEGGIASPDGHCRAFDRAARGTVSGSGAGVVVLKRLSEALADGDPIRAVLRGSAVNNDGSGKPGYTAPSVAGQAEVIRAALAVARCQPRDVSYVEAHGTGTPVGDPVEVAALDRAFAAEAGEPAWCALGSLKTNIGHLNAAAGVAGLIKTVLMLEHGELVPSLHFKDPNPAIDFDGSPFRVCSALREWPRPRRAGVSSFSIGGTNAHVVLEEAPALRSGEAVRPCQLLVLSARTAAALESASARLAEWLERRRDLDLADVAFTLQKGREAFLHRRTLVAYTGDEAAALLRRGDPERVSMGSSDRSCRGVAFLFPGQAASRHLATGRRLFEVEPVFRREVDRCAAILKPCLGEDVREWLVDGAADLLRRTEACQPFLFVVELALARLWSSWGLHPEAMLGHSLGEYTAACLSGVFELEEALELVAYRGRLLQGLPEGAMLAVALSEETLAPVLQRGPVSLAAVNGPGHCVLSGPVGAIDALEAELAAAGAACRRLATDRAFHSSAVDEAVEALVRRIAGMERRAPRIPFLSNLTGTWIREDEAKDPAYWGRHLREPVLFSRGLAELWRAPDRILLEVGPGRALTRLAQSHPARGSGLALPSLAGSPEDAMLLAALGQMWGAGLEVDWHAFQGDAARRRVPLPTYPFERRSYWLPTRDLQEMALQPPSLPFVAPSEEGAGGSAPVPLPPAPPASEEERRVVELLRELLGVERVGGDDDFFALGGHSLLAVQVINRLRLAFAVDLSLSDLFEHPTPRRLAARIAELRRGSKPARLEARAAAAVAPRVAVSRATRRRLRFGLFFFPADSESAGEEKYRLLLECARFADAHGFEALWTPERHFQRFGGDYPNPSVLSAALVAVTRRIEIRAGSLVLPLHNPVRVAEDWAVLDNLSGGRVGLSVASGWHPDDFALAPEAYADRSRRVVEGIDLLRRLWRGETLPLPGGNGRSVPVSLRPRPLRPDLPIWITSSGNLDSWIRAGEMGTHVLSGFHADLQERIALYRRTREAHGHDPGAGRVSVMLHTYVSTDSRGLEERIRGPLLQYLLAFAEQSDPLRPGEASPSRSELREMAEFRFEKLLREGSLLGSPETCAQRLAHLEDCGADEVACLIDFGLDEPSVLGGLENLAGLLAAAGRSAAARSEGLEERASARAGIPSRTGDGPWPLTFEQERLWTVQQLFTDSAAYNIGCSLRFRGPFDPSALQRALDELVRRHEILRTRFFAVDGQPLQEPCPPYAVSLSVVDLEAVRDSWSRAGIEQEMGFLARRPFDLASGRPLRAVLLRIEPAEQVVFLTLHHIVSDWWSFSILRQEIRDLYGAFARGEASPLPPLPLQYADFAVWLRNRLEGEELERHFSHWRRELSGAPSLLALPTDRPRSPVVRFRGARYWFSLPPELSGTLRQLARSQGTTPFSALLTGLFAWLYRATEQEDILVGSPVADRPDEATEKLIGYFLNMLVLRGDLSGETGFRAVLDRVRERVVGALAHPHLPLLRLISELKAERSLGHAALFQVAFLYLLASDRNETGAALAGGDEDLDPGIARFDLTWVVEDRPEGFLCFFEYNQDLFDSSTVTRMAGHLRSLLSAALEDPDEAICDLALLAAWERHQLLFEWNDTAAVPFTGCLPDLVEEQVRRVPDAVAVLGKGGHLTYDKLDRAAEDWAQRLTAGGAGPERRVGIDAEREIATVAALFGIVKTGAAFVPLDPSHPTERLSFVLADAGASVLVATSSLLERLPGFDGSVLCREDRSAETGTAVAEVGSRGEMHLESLAYMLYTSGSTGRPKGVEISHGSLANLLVSMATRPGFVQGERLVAITSLSFDIAGLEIFLPLVTGGTVVLAEREDALDGARLGSLLAGAQVFQATPATWRLLLEGGWKGERGLRALIGAEAVPPRLAEELLERVGSLWNVYGPTETTIWSSAHRVERGETDLGTVPIGRPIAATQIHVLDPGLRPVPIGVVGDLYIGGSGLARCYRSSPEQTAWAFVPDPLGPVAGGRLYRTGDLVRRLADGRLDCLGRRDHQVKVRGFRIELSEIEAALARHPQVHSAAVLVREETTGDGRLIAFVVGGEGERLRDHLSASLPDYMIPSSFVPLASLPRMANGKVDRRALASLKALPDSAGTSPRTPIEEVVAGVYADLLGLPTPSVETHFFSSGGHSLSATRAVARLGRALGVELPLRAIFEAPTVEALAKRVETARLAGAGMLLPPLKRTPRGATAPLSFAQERLWFLAQLDPESPAYNMPRAVHLEGKLEVEALAAALTELVRRHEVLRTCFQEIDGKVQQVVQPPRPVALPRVDLGGLVREHRTAVSQSLAAREALAPFDLSVGPVLRACLLMIAPAEHLLLLTLHHIASDGWSAEVLVRELTILYEAFAEARPSPLPDLPLQYADYAVWQRGWLAGGALERQLAFWRRQLAGAPEPTRLPFRRARKSSSSAGGSCLFTVPDPVSEALRRLARQTGSTLYMAILAAFEALLYRVTGETDLIIGTDLANRRHVEVEGLIGFFVNVLPVRISAAGQPSFRELLARVRETALALYDHQDVPLQMIVETSAPGRGGGRAALFEMQLVFEPPVGEARAAGLRLGRFEVGRETSRFDFTLYMRERAGRLQGSFNYREDLFAASDVELLADRFQTLLANVGESPETRLDDLDVLTERERRQRDREHHRQEQESLARFKRARPQPMTGLQDRAQG